MASSRAVVSHPLMAYLIVAHSFSNFLDGLSSTCSRSRSFPDTFMVGNLLLPLCGWWFYRGRPSCTSRGAVICYRSKPMSKMLISKLFRTFIRIRIWLAHLHDRRTQGDADAK